MKRYFLTARSQEIKVEPLELPKMGFDLHEPVEVEYRDDTCRGLIKERRDRTIYIGVTVYSVEFRWRGQVRLAWFEEDEIQPLNAVDQLAMLGRTMP